MGEIIEKSINSDWWSCYWCCGPGPDLCSVPLHRRKCHRKKRGREDVKELNKNIWALLVWLEEQMQKVFFRLFSLQHIIMLWFLLCLIGMDFRISVMSASLQGLWGKKHSRTVPFNGASKKSLGRNEFGSFGSLDFCSVNFHRWNRWIFEHYMKRSIENFIDALKISAALIKP